MDTERMGAELVELVTEEAIEAAADWYRWRVELDTERSPAEARLVRAMAKLDLARQMAVEARRCQKVAAGVAAPSFEVGSQQLTP